MADPTEIVQLEERMREKALLYKGYGISPDFDADEVLTLLNELQVYWKAIELVCKNAIDYREYDDVWLMPEKWVETARTEIASREKTK